MGTYDLGGVAGGKGKDTSVNIALNPEEIDLDDDTLNDKAEAALKYADRWYLAWPDMTISEVDTGNFVWSLNTARTLYNGTLSQWYIQWYISNVPLTDHWLNVSLDVHFCHALKDHWMLHWANDSSMVHY